jgi:hypothetical protein
MAEQSTQQVFIRSDRQNIVQFVIPTTAKESGTVTHDIVRVMPGLNVLDAAKHKAISAQMSNVTDIAVTRPLGEMGEREALGVVKATVSKDALELALKAEKRAAVAAAISSQLDEIGKKAKA